MDVSVREGARREAAASSIRTLRTRLLDLTARNPLVSFPHGRQLGTRTNLRAVNGHLDIIYDQIAEGHDLPIHALPAPDHEPEDERTEQFRAALDAARITDNEHRASMATLSDAELTSAKAARIERTLRDRVRECLGMPSWRPSSVQGVADYAAALGIDPAYELLSTPDDWSTGGRGHQAHLQTLMLPDVMERALAKIRDTARTVAEETGVSTLHLAFGFLEWFESDNSDRPKLTVHFC